MVVWGLACACGKPLRALRLFRAVYLLLEVRVPRGQRPRPPNSENKADYMPRYLRFGCGCVLDLPAVNAESGLCCLLCWNRVVHFDGPGVCVSE